MEIKKFVGEKLVVWKEGFSCNAAYKFEEQGDVLTIWFENTGEFLIVVDKEEIKVTVIEKENQKSASAAFRKVGNSVFVDISVEKANITCVSAFVNGVISNVFTKMSMNFVSLDITEKLYIGVNKVSIYIDTNVGKIEIVENYSYLFEKQNIDLDCIIFNNSIGRYYGVEIQTNATGACDIEIYEPNGSLAYSSPLADKIYPKISSGIKKVCISKKGNIIFSKDVYFRDKRLNYAILGNRLITDMDENLIDKIIVNDKECTLNDMLIDHSTVNAIKISLKDGEVFNITI